MIVLSGRVTFSLDTLTCSPFAAAAAAAAAAEEDSGGQSEGHCLYTRHSELRSGLHVSEHFPFCPCLSVGEGHRSILVHLRANITIAC